MFSSWDFVSARHVVWRVFVPYAEDIPLAKPSLRDGSGDAFPSIVAKQCICQYHSSAVEIQQSNNICASTKTNHRDRPLVRCVFIAVHLRDQIIIER